MVVFDFTAVEGDKIAGYVRQSLTDYPGLSGLISFNDKGNCEGEVYRVYLRFAAPMGLYYLIWRVVAVTIFLFLRLRPSRSGRA